MSWYPRFSYDAGGGGGWTSDVQRLPDGRYSVAFDPMTLLIPDLNYATARIFGIPIPPPLNIAILPTKLVSWRPRQFLRTQRLPSATIAACAAQRTALHVLALHSILANPGRYPLQLAAPPAGRHH